MAAIDQNIEQARAAKESRLATIGYFIKRYPLGAAGAVIVAMFVLMAIFAPWITQFDPTLTNSRVSLARPGGDHPLGADFMGRDMWSRIVYGARISLAVGIGSTGLGCFFGVTIGLTSGYFGGWYDLIVQRVMDMMQSLPLLVMALVMTAALGPSLTNTICATVGTSGIEIAMMVLLSDGPSAAVITSAITNSGSDCITSITRCTIRSYQPPK